MGTDFYTNLDNTISNKFLLFCKKAFNPCSFYSLSSNLSEPGRAQVAVTSAAGCCEINEINIRMRLHASLVLA